MIKTQFFNEEIDSEGGLFPEERRALMQGTHPRQHSPTARKIYALLIDIGGEEEAATDGRRQSTDGRRQTAARSKTEHDSTAVTIVEVDTTTAADPGLRGPTYRAVDRNVWTGVRQPDLFGQVLALAQHWQAVRVVGDATGIGAGLMSFLNRALPGRVTRFVFTSKTKSDLGWNFVALCDGGRFKDYATRTADPLQTTRGLRSGPQTAAVGRRSSAVDDYLLFWQQIEACQFEILPGPGKLMRWGVPDGTRPTRQLTPDEMRQQFLQLTQIYGPKCFFWSIWRHTANVHALNHNDNIHIRRQIARIAQQYL